MEIIPAVKTQRSDHFHMTQQTIINDRKKCVQDSNDFTFSVPQNQQKKFVFSGSQSVSIFGLTGQRQSIKNDFSIFVMDNCLPLWEVLQMVSSEKGDGKIPTERDFCGFR